MSDKKNEIIIKKKIWYLFKLLFWILGEPGVWTHLVQRFPGSQLLPKERPDTGDQDCDTVSPAELAGWRHPHLHTTIARLPQVRNFTICKPDFNGRPTVNCGSRCGFHLLWSSSSSFIFLLFYVLFWLKVGIRDHASHT